MHVQAEEIARLKQLLERQQQGETIVGKDLPANSISGSKIRIDQTSPEKQDSEAALRYNKLQEQMEA